jgi:hypothetical protein
MCIMCFDFKRYQMRLRPREIHLLILSVDLFILNASFFLVRLFLDEGDPDCLRAICWSY